MGLPKCLLDGRACHEAIAGNDLLDYACAKNLLLP